MKRRTALGLCLAGIVLPGRTLAAPAVRQRRKPSAPRLPFDHDDGPAFAIVGGDLHIGDGTVIPKGVLEVRGTRIVGVGGPAAAAGLGVSVRRIDATGKLVTPGLIGGQTSLGLTEIDMEDSTRDTTRKGDDPIRANYDVAGAINADSSVIAVQAVDGVTSAAVTPSGGLIAGQVAWIDLVPGDHTGIVSKRRIGVSISMGQSYAGSRAASLAKLREVFDDADVYRKRRGEFDRRQSRDLAAHRLDLEALAPALDAEIPVIASAHRASDILAALEFARERGLRLVLVGATQAWKVADALAKADVPVLVRPSQNLPGGFDRLGARLDLAGRLHRAGVQIGIAIPGDAHNIRNITQEAGIAVAYGLDRGAALSAITHNIARAYGMDADYGSVAVGKVANLAMWDADPFELSSVPTQVWVRGRSLPMRSRQTDLRDRYLDLSRFRAKQ